MVVSPELTESLLSGESNNEERPTKAEAPSGDVEMQGLVGPLVALGNRVEDVKRSVDDRWNIKPLDRLRGPSLEFAVRLMLVSSFINDSIGVALHFPQQAELIRWGALGSVLLGAGLLAQSSGALCILVPVLADPATGALLAWTVLQPILYGQLSNAEMVSESLSLVGGLLTLRARLVPGVGDWTRLAGRLLLPAAYIRYAGMSLLRAVTPREIAGVAAFLGYLSLTALQVAALVPIVAACALVATGLKSRLVALFLAVVNLAVVSALHPFFLYIYRDGEEWKVNEDRMPMPSVAAGVLPGDLGPWQAWELHRYYFFAGVSTSGALMLLAQFGPGGITLSQKGELIMPKGVA